MVKVLKQCEPEELSRTEELERSEPGICKK